MESMPAADRFVGIDVSKSWVDVHVRPDGAAFGCNTDGPGLAELVRRVRPLSPRLIVMASGGYEGIVAASLAEAGLPTAIVNPRQVRSFAASPRRLGNRPRPTRSTRGSSRISPRRCGRRRERCPMRP